MPAIAFRKARAKDKKTQILLQILAELPDDNESDTCIRRWETFRSKFSEKAWVNVLQNPISRWTFDQTIDEKNDEFEEGSNCNLQVLCSPKRLEPYWRVAWRDIGSQIGDSNYNITHSMCNNLERPDLIMEIGYFCADSGLIKKRIVFSEIDGDNKTGPNSRQSGEKAADAAEADEALVDDDSGEESAGQEEDEANKKRAEKIDPIKLALKLMSSTSAQNALQADTYHIRANYVWYFDEMIEKSILSTTGFELPEFEEVVRTYTDKRSSDYKTIHHAIHFMHHMFTVHVKIAFLIHMQVLHNIDMRSVDRIDKRMCNNCFFVNFEDTHIPTEFTLQHC